MYRYRRKEPFRYEFVQPIYCVFTIENDSILRFDGEIIELSPNGLRLKSSENLPVSKVLHINFGINSTSLSVKGTIRWKKKYESFIIKGIHLMNDTYLQKMIISELKDYVKKNMESAKIN